jgi:hypothetical protein
MHDLIWASVAVEAGRVPARSALPDAPVATAGRPTANSRWLRPAPPLWRLAKPLEPAGSRRQATRLQRSNRAVHAADLR